MTDDTEAVRDNDFHGIVTKLRTTRGSAYALDVMRDAADRIEADSVTIARLSALIAGVRAEAGAAALEEFADSKWPSGNHFRFDTELSIRERAAALRSAPEGEHTEPTGEQA